MAKKKTKSSPKPASKSTKSHGQLFDSHPNLIWLLPIFLIIAAVAIIVYKNSMPKVNTDNYLNAEQIPQVDTTVVSPTEAIETPTGY